MNEAFQNQPNIDPLANQTPQPKENILFRKVPTGLAWVIIIISSLFLSVFCIWSYYYILENIQKPVACTTEAKICPDGIAVGRTGPNCEFAACPDITKDWQTYRNIKYNYELKYPNTWTVEEIKANYPGEPDILIEYIKFTSSDKKYFLSFSLKEKDSQNPFFGRTGVGGGEFMAGNNINVGDFEIKTTNLVYNGKVKEVFYGTHSGPGSFEIGNYKASAEFSYGENADYFNMDIKNIPELIIANQILSTFKFIK